MKFVVKIQEVKAQEREDALFECVLSQPLPRIKWMGKNNPLEDGEKYSIRVSEDKLIHTLLVRDCRQLDKGIYAAVAGIKSCSAWLVVQGRLQPIIALVPQAQYRECASVAHICRANGELPYSNVLLCPILVTPDTSSMTLLLGV